MSPTEKSRFCSICKKTFCCVECRGRHEENKHRDRKLNCALCRSQKLQLRLLKNKSLLCHIVNDHLPVHCCLCGETFEDSEDLDPVGVCKWWQLRRRQTLVPDGKSVLGTPPLIPGIKESESTNGECIDNFCSLISPPELRRNTSTPMIVGQKASFVYKTPSIPNFSPKTPTTDSLTSAKSKTSATFEASTLNDSESQYVSFPSTSVEERLPRSSLNYSEKRHLSRTNSDRKLDIMTEEETISDTSENPGDDHQVADMELTGIEGETTPDTQRLKTIPGNTRESESNKRVRFSDEYVERSASSGDLNTTETEEYFEAQTTTTVADSPDDSWTRICKDNKSNAEKESQNADGNKLIASQQLVGSSRVLMMVVVENNAAMTTEELINSGLKNLESIAATSCAPIENISAAGAPGCSSITTKSYHSVSSYECFSPGEAGASHRRLKALESAERPSSVGIFSAVAHAVRSVMKSFTGAAAAGSIAREHVSQRENIIPTCSPIGSSFPISPSASSLLPRPGKRARDAVEGVLSPAVKMEPVARQTAHESPLVKRHRGLYKIKARQPIARMRNKVTPPKGISSETQIFRQGSLSTGETILPLPARAHQSTQTE